MELSQLNSIRLCSCSKRSHSIIENKDGYFAIILEKGLEIVHLQGAQILKRMPQHRRIYFSTPEDYPTSKAGQSSELESLLDYEEVTEITMNPLLTPSNKWLNGPRPRIIDVAWGPSGILPQSSILAILTSSGFVSMYEPKSTLFQIINISQWIYEDSVKSKKLNKVNSSNYMKALRSNCELLQTTGIAWSDRTYEESKLQHAHFVTAQKNGDIYFWKLKSLRTYDTNVQLELAYIFNSNFHNINIINWVTLSDSSVALILGNTNGLMKVIKFEIKNGEFKILHIKTIWKDEDKLIIDKIITLFHETGLIIVFIKKSHLIALSVDNACDLLKLCFEDFENICITGMKMLSMNKFMITTLTGTIFEISLSLDSENIKFESKKIKSDIDFSYSSPFGLGASYNASFLLIITTPVRMVDKKHGKIVSKLFFCHQPSTDYLTEIFDDKIETLTNQWDRFDMLKILNNKVKPNIIALEKHANMPALQAKLHMWLDLIINQDTLDKDDLLLPILKSHAEESMRGYANCNPEHITKFQLRTIAALIHFLNNCIDGNQDLIKEIEDIFGPRLPKLHIQCEWCGEEIKLIKCSEKHPRQWCCVTLLDIPGDNVLSCLRCKSLAHPDTTSDSPICTFCDSHFKRIYV